MELFQKYDEFQILLEPDSISFNEQFSSAIELASTSLKIRLTITLISLASFIIGRLLQRYRTNEACAVL